MATEVTSPKPLAPGEAPAAQPIPRLLIPELDKCIQCGFCLQACPTYRLLGVEPESPRGRIHLIEAAAQGRIPIDARFEEHMYVCLGCRACETACPAGVKFGTIIEAARAEIGPTGSPVARAMTLAALRRLMPYPGRLRAGARLLRLYQRSGLGRLARRLGLMPKRLAEMESLRIGAPFAIPTVPRGLAIVVSDLWDEGLRSQLLRLRSETAVIHVLSPEELEPVSYTHLTLPTN